MIQKSIVLASAGSGKTYLLANRIIAWMVMRYRATGSASPDRILATTFSRKAAGEILERIQKHLSMAILDEESLEQINQNMSPRIDMTVDEIEPVLKEFTLAMHRLQIGTIDGVFNRMARCLSSELDMPIGWTIADQQQLDALDSAAMDHVLGSMTPDKLSRIMHMMSLGRNETSPRRFLLERVRSLQDVYSQSLTCPDPDAPWNWLIDNGKRLVPGAHRLADHEIEDLLERLRRLELPLNKDGTTKKAWIKAVASIMDDVASGRWKDFLAHKLVVGLETTGEFGRVVIPDDVRMSLEPLRLHAVAHLMDLMLQEASLLKPLMDDFTTARRDLQMESGLYGFSDVSNLLARSELGPVLETMWYRLDASVQDLAFDEFQDTSVTQFQIMEPLIEEIMSGSGSHDLDRGFLVLADPKQSIYGWRGGAPELIDSIKSRWQQSLASEEPLTTSYRSSQAVLDLVNKVFESIGTNRAITENDDDGFDMTGCAQKWGRDFGIHRSARPSMKGFVQVIEPETDQYLGDDEMVLRETVQLVEQLHSENPAATIGVLARRNTIVGQLVARLRSRGLDASEEGSSQLLDSQAVQVFLGIFRLASDPTDSRSYFLLANSPLSELLDLPSLCSYSDENAVAEIASASRRIRDRILDEGHGTLVAGLLDQVRGSCSARESLRLEQLAEVALQWQSREGLDLHGFLDHIESTRRGAVSDSPIRLMTIHASKGLEFDQVVLPELSASLATGSNNARTYSAWRSDPSGPVERIIPLESKALIPHLPFMKDFFEQDAHERLRDSLSGLYVAMTRARHAVHMIMKPLPKTRISNGTFPSTHAGIILAAIPELDDAMRQPSPERRVLYTHGDPDWSPSVTRPSPGVERSRRLSLPSAPTSPSRGIRRQSPSGIAHQTDSVKGISLPSRKALDHGTIIHELFSLVDWLDQGRPGRDQLEKRLDQASILIRRSIPTAEREELIKRFDSMLDMEQITDRLSRSAYADRPGTPEVLREHTIIARGIESITYGRFDRMVVGRDGCSVLWVDLLDYKTDHVGDQGIDSIIERYRPQLQAYADSIMKLHDIPFECITARLLLLGRGEDVRVDLHGS